MGGREILPKDVRVGDKIRFTYASRDVTYEITGVVSKILQNVAYLGVSSHIALSMVGHDILLLHRPPREVSIEPKDIRVGMYVKIDGDKNAKTVVQERLAHRFDKEAGSTREENILVVRSDCGLEYDYWVSDIRSAVQVIEE